MFNCKILNCKLLKTSRLLGLLSFNLVLAASLGQIQDSAIAASPAIQPQPQFKAQSKEKLPEKLPTLENTEWLLVSWTGGTPLSNAPITAQFERNQLTGSDGCNRYNTSYQRKGKTLEINAAIATTRRACPPDISEKSRQFLQLLGAATQYRITNYKSLQISYQYGTEQGTLLFTPKPASTTSSAAETSTPTPIATLEDKEWHLISLNGVKLVNNSKITALFKDGRLAGSGGCNRYTTGYKLKERSLTVNSEIASTMMACPQPLMSQEQTFLVALAGSVEYKIDNLGNLQITYQTKSEKGTLTFSSTSPAISPSVSPSASPSTAPAPPNSARPEPKPAASAKDKILYVNDKMVDCTGVAPQKCWQIRENPDSKWQLLYTPIKGFNYQPGYLYKISLSETAIARPPADGSSIQRTLIKILAQVPSIWLDKPSSNWNKAGATIPKAPKPEGDRPTVARCRSQIRSAATPEDKALTNAGWSLFGAVQVYDKTTLIKAMSAVDGMCRPLGYQTFVFQDGQYAGTLSPQVMNARTNGAARQDYLVNADNISAEYSRYGEQDALCCPPLVSRTEFKIEQKRGKPVVVLLNVTTESP